MASGAAVSSFNSQPVSWARAGASQRNCAAPLPPNRQSLNSTRKAPATVMPLRPLARAVMPTSCAPRAASCAQPVDGEALNDEIAHHDVVDVIQRDARLQRAAGQRVMLRQPAGLDAKVHPRVAVAPLQRLEHGQPQVAAPRRMADRLPAVDEQLLKAEPRRAKRKNVALDKSPFLRNDRSRAVERRPAAIDHERPQHRTAVAAAAEAEHFAVRLARVGHDHAIARAGQPQGLGDRARRPAGAELGRRPAAVEQVVAALVVDVNIAGRQRSRREPEKHTENCQAHRAVPALV